MNRTDLPMLSKSRFIGGLQCLKRLYLESYHRELMPPIDPAQQALFDSGTNVGELARELFPGGILIEEDHLSHSKAVKKTEHLLTDESVDSIYEAGFTFDDIRTRVDLLKRVNSNVFTLAEVKSSTSVKTEHIPDAAIQVYVAEGSGIIVRDVYLVHINNRYIFQGGEYEFDKLFEFEDITSEVRSYISNSLVDKLEGMRDTLTLESPPPVDIGSHCNKPYKCPFFSYCREGLPYHHIEQLPSARKELLDSLKSVGIIDIASIFPGFPKLTALQECVRESVSTGIPFVGRALRGALSEFEYPLRYLDFETFNPALPHYTGTRPYQVIPFQWSLHTEYIGGIIEHMEFLHVGSDDPRIDFIESLIEALDGRGTILTYSVFEETRLKQLASEFPRYSSELMPLIDRMCDLYKLVKSNYYHPEFHGSFSLKSVVPALVPEINYEELDIQEGSVAAVAFPKMIAATTDAGEKERIMKGLLEYCKMDTLAMVKLVNKLRAETGA